MPPDLLLALAPALGPLPLTLPIAWIDLKRHIIPNGLNLALLVAGLGLAAWRDPDLASVLLRGGEAALAYGLFRGVRALHARWRGRIGLGLGDVKFLAAATAWTGLPGLPLVLLVASLSALLVVGLARLDAGARLPFGPFLVLGLHAALALAPGP